MVYHSTIIAESFSSVFGSGNSEFALEFKYEVKVTKQALEQMRAIMELSALPQRYSLIDEEPWRSEGIRKPVVKNFLIYYWIDNECNKVQVTAVF